MAPFPSFQNSDSNVRINASDCPDVAKVGDDLLWEVDLLAVNLNWTERARSVVEYVNDARGLKLLRQAEQHSPLNQVAVIRIPDVTHASLLDHGRQSRNAR